MKKIMFCDFYGLTEAVIDGRKTMTRRIAYDGEIKDIHTGYMTEGIDAGKLALCDGNMIVAKSKYKLDEVVAVAQSYKDIGYTKEWVEQHISPNPNAKPTDPFEKKYPGWNNKMFVPAELNNAYLIKITDIKVEQLQDISEEDLEKEGVEVRRYEKSGNEYVFYHPNPYRNGNWGYVHYYSLQDAGRAFFDSTCGKGLWESNPWVFAYSFELVK